MVALTGNRPKGEIAAMQTHEIRLASRPVGAPEPANFASATAELPALGAGEIRVRNQWMSVDPYMRGRMSDRPSYVPPFVIGEALQGGAVGEVIESHDESRPLGALVSSMLGWRTVAQGPAKAFDLLPRTPGIPEQAYLGALGMPGLTAWAGLTQVGQIRDGETVFVSGAAGAVGSIVCQLAKLRGCTVVGTAGSDAKCEWLRGLGVDHAINYKTGDLEAHVKAAVPKGIDLYFDNVGGEHLEVAISLARPFARLVECGMISQYNNERVAPGPKNMMMIVGKRLRIQGFIVFDFADKQREFLAEVSAHVAEGRLKWEETVVDGLAHAPDAFIGLFCGANTGKMLVRL